MRFLSAAAATAAKATPDEALVNPLLCGNDLSDGMGVINESLYESVRPDRRGIADDGKMTSGASHCHVEATRFRQKPYLAGRVGPVGTLSNYLVNS